MRKYIATIALIITLIGTFAPVVFSVNGLQKNIASASTTVVFGKSISIKQIPGKSDYYQLETTIQYDTSGFSSGSDLNGFNLFGTLTERNPHYQVINTTTGAIIIDKPVTEPEKLGLQNEKYGPLRQDIQITTPGKYEAWFYEDYITGNNLLSSKIKFEITADKKLITGQTNQTTNVRGDDQVGFTPITGTIAEGSTTARFSVGVTYKNETKQATEDAEENLYWFLKDESGTLINENAINLNPKPKYNTLREFAIDIPNLELGKKYTITFVEKDIVTAAGRMISSQEFPFTAGVPIDNAATQQQIQQQNANNALADLQNSSGQNGTDNNDGLECKLTDFDFFCYLVKFTVYITTFVPNVIATVSGLLSDFFLKFAMDPKMYGLSYTEGLGSMIYGAWSIVRDFANIGFIFALFVAAFMLILNKNQINNVQFEPKRVVVRVVIMALLVNFSLMFCRVIIQSADVFSHILYNKIVVDVKGETAISTFLKEAGVKSVSFGLVTNTNPQQLFMNQGVSKDDSGSYTAYLAIGFITFFIYLIYIYLFVSMMLLWMGRIFGAWIAMILSPIAFVSWAIPFIEDDKHIGFTNWLQNFVKLAFMVPIYLFFVYITIEVMNLQNLTTGIINDPNAGWMFTVIVTIIKVLLPLLAATFILMKGKTIAYDMSGEIGKVAGKFTGMATSLALGAATGGSALLARQTLGRAGSAIANKYASNTSMLGKGMNSLGNKMGAATFDVRNSKTMMKGFGGFTKAAGDQIDLGNRGLQEKGGFLESGGFTQMYEDRKARIADEKATKLEQEALARANNPQSRENIAKRNTERAIAANKKAKEAEEAKIALEAENQTVDGLIDAENQKLGDINSQINDVDARIANTPAVTAAEEQQALQEKNDADAKVAELQRKLADNAKKRPSAGFTRAAEQKAIDDERAQLEAEQAAAIANQQTKTTAAADISQKKQDHNKLLAEKQQLENEKTKTENKINNYSAHAGKTVAQMKHEVEIKKLEAQKSPEGIALAAAEAENKRIGEEVNKLSKEEKELRKEGKIAEADALKEKIKAEKAKIESSKKDGAYKKAKDAFDAKHADIKELDDLQKSVSKQYIKGQQARITSYNETALELNIQLKKDDYAIQQRRKEILGAHADAMDRALVTNSNIAGGFTQAVGVITGGRVMGGSVNNAGNSAATAARNRARTGR